MDYSFSDYGGSEFLKTDDLPEGFRKVMTIERYEETELDGKRYLVLFFQGATKGLVLKPVNTGLLRHAMGSPAGTRETLGRQIILKRDLTSYGNRMVPCMRLEAVSGQQQAQTPQTETSPPIEDPFASAAAPAVDPDDDVPF